MGKNLRKGLVKDGRGLFGSEHDTFPFGIDLGLLFRGAGVERFSVKQVRQCVEPGGPVFRGKYHRGADAVVDAVAEYAGVATG